MAHFIPTNSQTPQDGDGKDIQSIYGEYIEHLYVFFFNVFRSYDQAKDAAQEVMIKFWLKESEWPKIINIRAYIFRIARNHLLDQQKHQLRHGGMPVSIDKLSDLGDPDTYEIDRIKLSVARKLRDELLESLVKENKLPKQRLKIIQLCFLEGKTIDEIAELLNISDSTVRSHIRLATEDIVAAAKKLRFGPYIILLWLCSIIFLKKDSDRIKNIGKTVVLSIETEKDENPNPKTTYFKKDKSNG